MELTIGRLGVPSLCTFYRPCSSGGLGYELVLQSMLLVKYLMQQNPPIVCDTTSELGLRTYVPQFVCFMHNIL